jgi:putative phage-type endonuclease
VNIVDVIQGTPEWKAARAGKVTASKIPDVLAKGKGTAEAVTRRKYRLQLVSEILTDQPQEDGFTNAAMAWGTENEPYARAAYEILTGEMVDQVGMVLHPRIERAAASPDGLVLFDGLIEIKCPNTATHIDYLETREIPRDYQLQMLWQMACTGRQWCDFVSYDPRLPENIQLFKERFHRDDARIREIEDEVETFLDEVETMVKRLRSFKAAA